MNVQVMKVLDSLHNTKVGVYCCLAANELQNGDSYEWSARDRACSGTLGHTRALSGLAAFSAPDYVIMIDVRDRVCSARFAHSHVLS